MKPKRLATAAMWVIVMLCATVIFTALVARRLWGGTRAPLAAAVLLTLGLNAGAFVLWPLNLVRMWAGEVTGPAEFFRLAHHLDFGTARVIYSLSAPFAEMVSFLDKLLLGTAINFGYMQLTFFLWALVVFYFFRRFATNWKEENTYRRTPLTFDEVKSQFDSTPAPPEKVR